MRVSCLLAVALFAAANPADAKPAAPPSPHNVLIFVADGLRADSVNAKDAPTLWRVAIQGVRFTNPHSLYPTVTTVNASAIATGHYIGDTGNFGNALYSGFPSVQSQNAPIAILENDAALGEMDTNFGGNYLNETSLLAAARQAGFATAAVGKTGPTSIQDVTQRAGTGTIIVDDALNSEKGIALSPAVQDAIKAAGLASTAPKSAAPNTDQQQYMTALATKVVLPKLASSGHPFAMVYWSRDPDYSQHLEKDGSVNAGTGRAGIRDADTALATLLAALKTMGLDKNTDVFITADHGFSTIARQSNTSATARMNAGQMPYGFSVIDVADALGMPLFDPYTRKAVDYKHGGALSAGDGFLGDDPDHPEIIIVSNGGSDLVWLPGTNARSLAPRIVDALTKEDYVSGIFTNDSLGDIPGALPMSNVNLRGSALTPQPSIVFSFSSRPMPACKPLLLCASEVAETSLQNGQGMHGSFSRADTKNFMAAIGPDFKVRFADPAPSSNADIAPTLAHVLGLSIAAKGHLPGRVLAEALPGGKRVTVSHGWLASKGAANGQKTELDYQQVEGARYFDAAGFPGRTVGLIAH